MKTKPTFLTAIVFALPLALSTQSSTLAQDKNESKSPPAAASGQGRQIINKLNSIRFDSVLYDGLPLGEVVRNLMDQSRMRDPEKKGINFVITPNGDTTPAPSGEQAAPAEAVDMNAISIRIVPALNDVRLVDVLDAVVKVADHPIKYTVEDYGVVFTPKGYDSVHRDEAGFSFPGGTPRQLLEAVEKQCNVNWSEVADIPAQMQNVRIPALRIDQESIRSILTHPDPRQGQPAGLNPFAGSGILSEHRATPLQAVVVLYNHLGDMKPELGRLVVEGDLAKPSVVMFIPGNTREPPETKVKAFPLKGILEKDWDKLEQDILMAQKEWYNTFNGDAPAPRTTVEIHRATSLIVATGPAPFMEMVESMVAAYRENAQAEVGLDGMIRDFRNTYHRGPSPEELEQLRSIAGTNSPPKQK